MSIASPFTVAPPAWVRMASGWRAAMLLPDGTLLARALVMWPLSPDVHVRERGRVDVEVSRANGPWLPQPAAPGAAESTFVVPVQVGQSMRARARYVNGNGRASGWIESDPHVVIEPIESVHAGAYDSAANGWSGAISGGATQHVPERILASADSWTEGLTGTLAGGVVEPHYATETSAAFDSLRDGWRGTRTGCTTTPI